MNFKTSEWFVGRFRVKQGEFEVEYEGEDSSEKYDAAIELIESVPKVAPAQAETRTKQDKSEGEKRAPERPSEATLEGFEMPKKGKLGKIEFSTDGLKFPKSSFENLTIDEAIGLLLHEFGQAIRPAIITVLLSKGWKKVSPNNVRSRLTGKGASYVLAKHVVKEGDGYRLTGQGNEWIKGTVVAKLETPN